MAPPLLFPSYREKEFILTAQKALLRILPVCKQG